jgi:hypothetical protein
VPGRSAVAAVALLATVPLFPVKASSAVDILRATGGLPAHIANQFEEPIGFAEATTGEFVVLDRRAHTVYLIDRDKKAARKIIEIGFEKGRVLGPGVLSLSADDIFAVADAPNRLERIQYFSLSGLHLGGFYLQSRSMPRLAAGVMVLNGVGSMSFTGRTFLISRPETGALLTELDNRGFVLRSVGALRKTGHESDNDVHMAMNAGLPLAIPGGGFYFVFMAGVPAFRKYDANGKLLFERHIEGPELDADVQALPTTWPRRDPVDGVRLPLIVPLIRTAAVDPMGRLWVSLVLPYTYVFAPNGDKQRTVQFHGAMPLSVTSLTFAKGDRILVTPGLYEFSTR